MNKKTIRKILKRVMNVKHINKIVVSEGFIHFSEMNKGLNINTVVSECKKYASEQSYTLCSCVHMVPKRTNVAGCQIHWRWEDKDCPYKVADTEAEAVFKAMRWIFKNEKKEK